MAPSRRALAAAVAVLGLVLPALGREDDVDFAIALAARGYDDLAQKEADRMPAGENREYTRCQLLRRSAILAADNDKAEPKDVRAKFAAAGKAFDAFLKAFPNSRLKNEAEFHMANLMKDFAYTLTKLKDRFPASEQEGVVQEANKTFEEAIQFLTRLKDRENQAAQQATEPPDENEDPFFERNKAWYFLCVAMHDRAMLLPPGDAVRIQQFTQAIEETKLLLEETDGNIFGFLAGMWLGLDYWHRGEMKNGWSADDIRSAREYFDVPLGSPGMYQNLEQDWPALVDVVFEASVHYGRMCNRVGTLEGTCYPKLLFDLVESIQQKLPSIKTKSFGLQTLIEKARAMSAIGMHEAAIALLSQVSNWATQADPSWGRAVDQMAKKGLNDVLSAIPPDSPVQVGADVLFKAGDGSRRDRNFARAVRAYQRTLLAIEAEPDPDRRKTLAAEYWAKCWLRINECYGWMERYLEAFYAADFPVQRYMSSGRKDDDPEIGELAYYRVTAMQELVRRAPKDQKADFQESLRKAQELYTSRFQGMHGGGESVSYTVGIQRLNQGTALMQSGETARGTEVLKEAIELFRKLGEKDAYYGFAQARIGEALVQMRRHEDALRHLNDFIGRNTAEWTNPSTPAKQRQPWGWATFWIANAYDAMQQPAKVVEALDGFERKFEGASLDNSYPRIRYLRITALVKAGRGAEAEKEAEGLKKDSPDNSWTPQACLVAANDIKARADRFHKDGNRKAEMALKKRSLEFYDFWVRRSPDAGAEEFKFVGSLFNETGNADRAAELWQKALDIYQRQGNASQAELITIYLSGLLVGQGKYAEALPKFETLFVKTPEDVVPLRSCLAELKRRPTNVPQPEHEKSLKDTLTKIAEDLARDPAGLPGAAEAKRAAAALDVEILVRAFADTPDLRRALARAAALNILGTNAAMPPDLKLAVFSLVKRTPDLMSNLSRCYEELATANPQYPIRAANLYSVLLESAPEADDPEAPTPGTRYSERWFEWKFRWAKVYLVTGTAYKSEAWLQIVCKIVAGMETLNELRAADRERTDFSKEFLALKDQADAALRGLGKEGCK